MTKIRGQMDELQKKLPPLPLRPEDLEDKAVADEVPEPAQTDESSPMTNTEVRLHLLSA